MNLLYKKNNINFNALILLICLSIFIGLVSTIIGDYDGKIMFVLSMLLIPIVLLVLSFLILEKSINTLKFMSLLIVFQNTILIIISRFVSHSIFKILIMFKEIFIILLFVTLPCFGLKNKKIVKSDILGLFSVIIILLYFIFRLEDISQGSIISLRQLLLPFILYFFGRSLSITKVEYRKFISFFIILAFIIASFGFIEMIIGDRLWINLGIEKFMVYKGMERWANGPGGLPGNYYTFDLFHIIGKSIRRMVSFIADPTLLAQFLALPLMILIFNTNLVKNKVVLKLIIASLILAILLTLGKGGMLIVLISYSYGIRYIKKKIYFSRVITLTVITTGVAVIIYSLIYHTSITNHFSGLVYNIKDLLLFPFGRGIGFAGNYSKIYGITENIGAGESYIGVVIGQMGIIGLILYGVFFYSIVKQVNLLHFKEREFENIKIILIGNFIGMIIASSLSESAISFISSSMYFINLGLLINYNTHRNSVQFEIQRS